MGGNYSLFGSTTFVITGLRNWTESGFLRNSAKWIPKDLEVDLTGKVMMVTGSNQGIGYAVAEELAKRKATVVMVCRNKEKGQEAVDKISSSTNNPNVKLFVADLSRPSQIKKFAEEYVNSGQRLDVLINNAGVLAAERSITPDGIENTFATNTLATFLLTEYLLPALKRSAPSRVITVSSGGMYSQKMDTKDFQYLQGAWDGVKAYAFTKRHQICLNEIWAKKYADTKITFNTCHPGWVRTPGTKSSLPPSFDKLPLRNPSQKIKGADTIVWLAVAEKVAKETGKFWFDRESQPTHFAFAGTHSSSEEYDQLWNYLNTFKKEVPSA